MPTARPTSVDRSGRQSHVKPASLVPRSTTRPAVEVSACSDEIGEAILFSRGGNSQSSLARSAVEFSSVESEEIRVPVVTLDSYFSEHPLPEPRCVKIDAEGAEPQVIRGAERMLKEDRPVIVSELHPTQLDRASGMTAANGSAQHSW